jgi:opacity protein-like surface antigen
MKKFLFLFLLAGSLSTTALAQSSFSIQYSLAFGGSMNDYITSTSVRGATFEYKMYPSPNVSVGIDAGWNHFYERRAYSTYTDGTLSLSGVQFRYANAVPIFVTASYYLKPGEKINPFIGLGVGTVFMSRYVDMGQFRVLDEEWHFALKPEAGVLVSLSPDMDLILGFRYNNAFATSDTDAISYMMFNVGFVWK